VASFCFFLFILFSLPYGWYYLPNYR